MASSHADHLDSMAIQPYDIRARIYNEIQEDCHLGKDQDHQSEATRQSTSKGAGASKVPEDQEESRSHTEPT